MPYRWIVVLVLMSACGGAVAQASPAALDRLDLLPRQGTSEPVATPIYGQVVLFSQPDEFRTLSAGVVRKARFEHKAVPTKESLARWTQMITVSGDEAEAFSGRSYPKKSVDDAAERVRRNCPGSFGVLPLDGVFVGSYDTAAAVFGCGAAAGGQSETTMLLVIKGGMDVYTIDWTIRGPSAKGALKPDAKEWTDRLRRLGPIRLCAASEAPPYPNCLKKR